MVMTIKLPSHHHPVVSRGYLVGDDSPGRVEDQVEGVALSEVEPVGEDDIQSEAEISRN